MQIMIVAGYYLVVTFAVLNIVYLHNIRSTPVTTVPFF